MPRHRVNRRRVIDIFKFKVAVMPRRWVKHSADRGVDIRLHLDPVHLMLKLTVEAIFFKKKASGTRRHTDRILN